MSLANFFNLPDMARMTGVRATWRVVAALGAHFGTAENLDRRRASRSSSTRPLPFRARESRLPRYIMMIGLRGCPNVQGGVERHVEQLAPLIAESGCRVEVIARKPYVRAQSRWRNVAITPLWAPRMSGLEAIVHTGFAVFYAAFRRPDIVHIHAIGPSLLAPFARLLGLRVVVTHHGFDYDRAKWGRFAKFVLKAGEHCGMRFSNARIAVSTSIAETVEGRFRRKVVPIPNGVSVGPDIMTAAALDKFGLAPKRYILTVGRLEPEKRHADLIAAFKACAPAGWKLVIVGASDHPGHYVRGLETLAAATPGVVMTGFQSGTALAELYAHAGLFVLPSSHEGLPMVLLEATVAGLPVLASDIPANREVQLPEKCYFGVGDIASLANRMREAAARPLTGPDKAARREIMVERYSWGPIAERTLAVYREVMR